MSEHYEDIIVDGVVRGRRLVVDVPAVHVGDGARRIFVGSFFDRFGPHKWAILADATPMVQALVKDCQIRRFIDLDNPDLLAGLAMLVSAGHAIDPAAVLGAPVTEDERWTG
jgi:hypothetical protein